jgi:hypothetical protein
VRRVSAEGDNVDSRAFRETPAPREFFLPRTEILEGQPRRARFRVTDDQRLITSASWRDLVREAKRKSEAALEPKAE